MTGGSLAKREGTQGAVDSWVRRWRPWISFPAWAYNPYLTKLEGEPWSAGFQGLLAFAVS